MTTSPYMPLYVADYLVDTMHLTTEEHGAYLLLLMAYWQSGRPLPADPRRLAGIAKVTNERWTDVERTLREYFRVDGDQWIHARMEIELNNYREKVLRAKEAGKASGRSRKRTDVQRTFNGRSTDVERMSNGRGNGKPTESQQYLDSDSDSDSDLEVGNPSASKKLKQTAHFTSLVGDAAREEFHDRTQNVQKGSGQFDVQFGSEVTPAETLAIPSTAQAPEVVPEVARRGEVLAAPVAPSAPIPSGYNPKQLRPPVVTNIDREWAMAQRPDDWDEALLAWSDHVAEQAEAFEEFYASTPKPAAEWSGMWRRVWWPKADPNIRHPEVAPQIPHPFFKIGDPEWAAALAVLKPDERKVAERYGVVQFRPDDARLVQIEKSVAAHVH